MLHVQTLHTCQHLYRKYAQLSIKWIFKQ